MFVQALVAGIPLGFLYGLVALTLILLVRATGVLNFATAEIGTFCAFVAYVAITQFHLPVALGLAVAALFAIGFGAVAYVAVILSKPADVLVLSLRTLGLSIILRALAEKFWGRDLPYSFPRLFPDSSLEIFGLNVSYLQLSVIFLALLIAVLVAMLMEGTRIGLMLRAISADRKAAANLGVAVVRIDLFAWCLATLVAGMVGILVAQLNYLAPEMMDPVLLAGFAAAQLGDMRNTRIALLAGVGLGVTQSISSVYLNQPEISQILAFAVLLLGLLLRSHLRKQVVVT